MTHSIQNLIGIDLEQLVLLRRHIHQHPEVSGKEYQTTKFLAEQLAAQEIPFRLGPDERGLIVDLGDPDANRRVALRADIDAIPVTDSKNVGYKSANPECMHACGHDAHSTMLFAALVELKDWFASANRPGVAVRGIFQPEEEIAAGAKRLINAGVLENVHGILGLHVDPTRPTGTVGLRVGVMTANCDEVTIKVFGRSGHAARPHETVDPIAAATQFVQTIYSTLGRKINSLHPAVFTICQFTGGHSANVTPDSVYLQGTLRTLDHHARDVAIEHVSRIANSVSVATDARFEVSFGAQVPAVVNDPTMIAMVEESIVEVIGVDNVHTMEYPSMGGEDFAYYTQQVPAAFFRLGCAGNDIGDLPLHNSGFDIDENILPLGAKIFFQSAVKYLERN